MFTNPRTRTKSIDWTRTEDYANGLRLEQLEAAIDNAVISLEGLDDLDRATGGDSAGYVRDGLSVYRRVHRERTAAPPCKCCGRR